VSNTSEFSDSSNRTNGVEDGMFMDVYRESQLNGFRRLGRRKGNGQFVQEDDEEDLGSLSKTQSTHKPAPVSIPSLEKSQLDRRSVDLCRELRTIAKLSNDFRQDVADERMSSSDLLAELGSKIRPFLVRLDEEMAVQEEMVKKNLDACRITDQKVDWLLRHNKFMLEFRRLVEHLTNNVYDELERLLRLKVRGVHGAALKENVEHRLEEIVKTLDDVEAAVMKENTSQCSSVATSDRFKPASMRSA